MRKLIFSLVAAMFAVSFIAISVAAQSQLGTVSGRVTDASGAVVADAKVTLTNVATNVKVETQTNTEGYFVYANIPPATYDVTVEKQGFRKITRRVTLAVGSRVDVEFTMQLGAVTETVVVSESAITVNTVSGELSRQITTKDLETLPLFNRDAYRLVTLTAGAADTGSVTGDTRGGSPAGGGGGVALNGTRTSSLNFMLDGGENNDTFVAGVGQNVPLDAVQEFKVQTNGASAEYGRSPINVNVATKSGSNSFHGSAYEYYRGAATSTNTFENNATTTPKPGYVRNQFGGSFGGPIIKDKTFFFGSLEGLRVRSGQSQKYFVPTPDFLSNASAAAQGFINAFPLKQAGNCSDAAITAQQIVESIEGGSYATSPLISARTGLPIPASTQMACRVTLTRPFDAGGGQPQNTWLTTGRVDHTFSANTRLMGRYAFQQRDDLAGAVSFSPFTGFDTGQTFRNQNINVTLTHTFSPKFFSEFRFIYNRLKNVQPLGAAPATTACWQYDLFNLTPTGDLLVFPGYSPDVCSFAGIPFGGPQNVYQWYGGFTYLKGRHTFQWGAQYIHLRDNRTFGAYENAYFDTFDFQGMLDGRVDLIFAAINPRGKVPGDTYSPAVDGPYIFPSFTRHFRYNEIAVYGEDSIKITPRLTLGLGMRWEYFGILHSPKNERLLDSNLYLDAVGTADPSKSIFEQIRDARFRRTNQFYKPDWGNFGPRASLAWDVLGNNRTVFRAAYGLYYERNFGNAVFNSIQNPPNYAVISPVVTAQIAVNQFDAISALGPQPISSSARMLDNNLRTSYTAQWNATLEHNVLGKGIIASVSYVGTNGYNLYSLNNLNARGSCIMAPTINAVCNAGSTGLSSRLNQTGLTGMNRRSNEAFSRYNGLQVEVRSPRIGNTGLTLLGNYTWSHSFDNESSFFADSTFEGFEGFGFRDAFNPGLDKASSSNDIRHRGTLAWTWEIPGGKGMSGVAKQVFGGWAISGTFVAQTGGAFSMYDGSSISLTNGASLVSQCNRDATNFCYPVITGAVPSMTDTATSEPNRFVLYPLSTSGTFQPQLTFCGATNNPALATAARLCTSQLNFLTPQLLSPRNLLRTPGYWTTNAAVLKDFFMPWEGHRLQVRAEFFNVFNHSNLFALSISGIGSNVFTGTNDMLAARGLRPDNIQERRTVTLALRYIF